ncbi:hypothetical protein GC088_01655 [Arthrobacter sp. JZ12]|uniref:DUF6707 family protein n=1 Tax=Arthrobacter sp. JZ12 TaxID=2654190 RepID=UPI002B48E1E2|nr:DUF6707 family protein [Arthrobacter sp. JZ12]WRH23946.1 hypothetical protein GC088_01655 [Arthrobacter sp. JZ12]
MIDSDVDARVQPLAAEALSAGRRLLLPGGERTAEVVDTAVEHDDFGVPAVVVVTLESGETLRIATGSTVQVEPAEEMPLITADEGSPEALVAHVAAIHPESPRVQELAERLTRGVNFKSGSNLQDIRDLALTLYVDLSDPASALRVCDLLTDQPFDGNFGRWNLIEACLALAAHLTSESDPSRAAAYSAALRTADDAETDPLKAKLAAAVRQRQLNEPNLYDREIARASDDPAVEKDWRGLRLSVLLYLRAHGGSETLSPEALDRRIGHELLAIRALGVRLSTSG